MRQTSNDRQTSPECKGFELIGEFEEEMVAAIAQKALGERQDRTRSR
jgi:hypothetical protein